MTANKIDFAVVFSVQNANPNGDPLNENRPRQTLDGYGEVSDVCLKRKIRNRVQDMGGRILVQSADRSDDGCKSIKDRATPLLTKCKTADVFIKEACAEFYDVRSFGHLFAFKKGKDCDIDTASVKGPVTIRTAFSVNPISIEDMQITKSVNSETSDKRGSDTMGMKHTVDFGVYVAYGSVNVQLAEKSGFSDEDAETLKQALITLFENDCSSARPDGSMCVEKVVWWTHNTKLGQYPSAKVHRSLKVVCKNDNPRSMDDVEITLEKLDGLKTEEF